MLGSKLEQPANSNQVKFNISANLEEVERGVNKVSLRFAFVIITNPRVVKYQIEGATEIKGQIELVKKILKAHQSTKVPMVLYDIYQHVYPSIFVLAKTIDAPCPSPELLSTSPASQSNGANGQDIEPELEQEAKPELVVADEEVSS
jgi:hypothetical protein